MRRTRKLLQDLDNRSKGVRNNPVHFIFFDTETAQTTEVKKIGNKKYKTVINTLQLGWCVYWNREINHSEWLYFENVEEFHKFITHVTSIAKNKTIWIVAHNIVFDNFITDIWNYLSIKKYEVSFIHSKGMVFLQKLGRYTTKENKKGNEVRKSASQIMLVNNGNLFPEKLENIGETIGFPKLKVNFQESSKEEIKIYCKRDVEILLEFWKQWAVFISENDLGSLKYTISSQSMEAFKHKFCQHNIVIDDDLDVISFERKAYYGGRTEIFYKGAVQKKINYYDVNSMYPYVMRNFNYPTEHKFTKINPLIEQVEFYIKKGWLLIAECYIDTKINAYPCKQENTLLFPIGKFKTYLATPEIIEALKNNDIKKFGRVELYKGSNIFKDYIDFFYNKRVELKRDCMYKKGRCIKLPHQKFKNNHILCNTELCYKCEFKGNKQEKMYKLFLNSLYGKFGAKTDKWQPIKLEDVKTLDPEFDLTEWILDNYKIPKILIDGIDLTPKLRYIGNELQMSGEEGEDSNSFPAIAAHVTSYARMVIWKAIKYCQENGIGFYCDTDSIFTDIELPPELVDENDLGKFKIEKVYAYGVEFINLKNYCALNENGKKVVKDENDNLIEIDENTFVVRESKILKGKEWKMKGVSAGAELKNENTFIQQEWGGLPKQEYYTKFGRKAGEFWIIYKEKSNKGTIKKGRVKGKVIVPFELEEF